MASALKRSLQDAIFPLSTEIEPMCEELSTKRLKHDDFQVCGKTPSNDFRSQQLDLEPKEERTPQVRVHLMHL